jgi:RluA family pseudouridine synthase
LTVLAEGEGFVAIAKPPGRIVVPGRGLAAQEVTLRRELEQQIGRPLLVVHRLDRGTSGVLLLATDEQAHRALSRAFEHHAVVKRYWALVRGSLLGSGEVDRPLVQIRGGLVRVERPGESGGKASRTAWRALERLGPFTIVEFRPQTGRLHQIRAHALALGHPLAVDPDYGGLRALTARDLGGEGPPASAGDLVVVDRPTLHAWSVKFPHPRTAVPVVVEAPLSDDLQHAVSLLRGGPSGD